MIKELAVEEGFEPSVPLSKYASLANWWIKPLSHSTIYGRQKNQKCFFELFMIMKPLYSQTEFDNAKGKDKLPLKCYTCNKTFMVQKKVILEAIRYQKGCCKFCSKQCNTSKRTRQKVTCKNCKKSFYKVPYEIKKSNNHFCCSSCAATYNNKNKSPGARRSKLEIYLEKRLVDIYPNIEFHFNRKDAINSELDIYIPSLNLAFELNGIFHYEPIYGNEKLSQIQNNDDRKFQACLEQNIELVLIDISSQKYFKPKSSQKFLNIITEIIDKKLTFSKQ